MNIHKGIWYLVDSRFLQTFVSSAESRDWKARELINLILEEDRQEAHENNENEAQRTYEGRFDENVAPPKTKLSSSTL